jgi:hypothetical protein
LENLKKYAFRLFCELKEKQVRLNLTRIYIHHELISLKCSVTNRHENVASMELKRLTSKGLADINNDFMNFYVDDDKHQLYVDFENITENYGNL